MTDVDRHMSCLMPCAVSLWENDSGDVFLLKMNTGLMGKLFGGNVAAVMGNKVGPEEKKILSAVVAD